MYDKILIFGGTTEGRIATKVCDDAGKPFFYSTKSNLQKLETANGIQVSGAMEVTQIIEFCTVNNVKLIIDSAHPFAINLHNNIAKASEEMGINVIRLERKYTKENEDKYLRYFDDYTHLITFLIKKSYPKLLALTGVNTIETLKTYWQDNFTIFRILDRNESRQKAKEQKFPLEQIVYYSKERDELAFIKAINPSAIITKESGESGGLGEKIAVAKQLNIPIFIVKRPKLSPLFTKVYGEHGLRKEIEKSVPSFFDLKTGYTTGTCATGATKSALMTLLTGEINDVVRVGLPNGESITIAIKDTLIEENSVTCTVIKDAGDDPDVTHLKEIVSTVCFNVSHRGVRFLRGKGVGIVTLPGLGLEIGAPAVNKTPRNMIRREIHKVKRHYPDKIPSKKIGIDVTISVPEGEKLARSTFNPRLGIEGGISIIGTSGIVKPFSKEAFVASIRKEMQVAKALGSERVVLNSGAKSEKYIKAQYPILPSQSFIHFGNFVGESIQIASDLGFSNLTLGIMIGKAVKLAEGHLDTHSKKVVMNKDFIIDLAKKTNCNQVMIEAIKEMKLARQLWDIIPNDLFFKELTLACHTHCKALFPNGNIEILLIDDNGERIIKIG